MLAVTWLRPSLALALRFLGRTFPVQVQYLEDAVELTVRLGNHLDYACDLEVYQVEALPPGRQVDLGPGSVDRDIGGRVAGPLYRGAVFVGTLQRRETSCT